MLLPEYWIKAFLSGVPELIKLFAAAITPGKESLVCLFCYVDAEDYLLSNASYCFYSSPYGAY